MKNRTEKQILKWKAAAWDMLYLVICSINDIVPEYERVSKMDLQKVYALSKSQSLEAMTYMALERLIIANDSVKNNDPEQILEKWDESKNKAIRKTMLMNAARKQLLDYLEEKGIWHLSLKGIVLCSIYPEFGMRQMADNDILFDASFRKEVCNWFESNGYTVKSYGAGNHDEYHKKPVYNFEMHTALFHEEANTTFFQYYLPLKNRLCPVSGKKFEYTMKDEDFYVYIVAHMYKHYSNSGTGLRSLLDLYVYNKVKNNLDHEYVKEELLKTGLGDFEKEMRELAFKIFVPQFKHTLLTEKERKILESFMFNHTYGTMENVWRKQVKKAHPDGTKVTSAVKIKYFMARLFPDKEHMDKWCEMYSPFFFRNKWLMPIAYIWRIVKIDAEKTKIIKKEFKTVRKM